MSLFVAFDTSNYTTSVAVFDGVTGENRGRLLDVEAGQLGLRQSDALFFHVKRLPALAEELLSQYDGADIAAVAASTRPRAVEGSYMPCFLAGESHGRVLAAALGVPFYAFSHQQGHIAAACYSAGAPELMDGEFLCWHLSGGTTELLHVKGIDASRIGGTEDLAAGQLIDRTGVMLGSGFPAGKTVDALSQKAEKKEFFKVKLRGLEFSLSGLENKVKDMHAGGRTPEDISYFAMKSVCDAVERCTAAALEQYPGLPVVCSGGVACSSMLRQEMGEKFSARFALPRYSSDNAYGTAILCHREHMKNAR
ncbi:MAG: DNA-binding protein [Oscillospiraceae bacterium]|nr:DNA-binding protein [Oscillospiraceae bacterium]